MDHQHYTTSYKQNAATAETLLLREISRRQLQGYKFRRQVGSDPMTVEFVCTELKLVIELYPDQQPGARQSFEPTDIVSRRLELKGYQVARICHSEVLTNLVGVIDSLGAVIRQCRQALQMSKMACRYLSRGFGRTMGS